MYVIIRTEILTIIAFFIANTLSQVKMIISMLKIGGDNYSTRNLA